MINARPRTQCANADFASENKGELVIVLSAPIAPQCIADKRAKDLRVDSPTPVDRATKPYGAAMPEWRSNGFIRFRLLAKQL
jgi:hypothetical protein